MLLSILHLHYRKWYRICIVYNLYWIFIIDILLKYKTKKQYPKTQILICGFEIIITETVTVVDVGVIIICFCSFVFYIPITRYPIHVYFPWLYMYLCAFYIPNKKTQEKHLRLFVGAFSILSEKHCQNLSNAIWYCYFIYCIISYYIFI